MPTPLDSLVTYIHHNGGGVVLWSGRDPMDLEVDEDGSIRPLLEILRRLLREQWAAVVLSYSPSTGLVWDTPDLQRFGVRQGVLAALQAHKLIQPNGGQVGGPDQLMQGVWTLLQTPPGTRWPDGKDLRFALFLPFSEHLVPADTTQASDDKVRTTEWVWLLATSLAIRQFGHTLILYTPDEGLIAPRVRAVVPLFRIPQPDREAKARFIKNARERLYPNAVWEGDLDDSGVAYLTANTPNRSIEALLRRSHVSRCPIRADELIHMRLKDVESIAEGMLTPLEERDVTLRGHTIEHVWDILRRIAEGLRRGDPRTPANILLAGAPGVGKTDLACRLAREAGVPCYRVSSPKSGIVGETERRSALLFRLLDEWAPSVAFIDEFTETFPTDRPEHDLDAGASRAVLGAMLAFLGDKKRRGRTVFLAATNLPWRLSQALLSRFIIIPVLMPARDEYPAILATLIAQATGGQAPSPDEPWLRTAADIFYEKMASPRDMYKALDNAHLMADRLGPQEVIQAARDLRQPPISRWSCIYSELWAIRACSCRAFLPWAKRPGLPLPDHLKDIVNPETGEIDEERLETRLRELQPFARV